MATLDDPERDLQSRVPLLMASTVVLWSAVHFWPFPDSAVWQVVCPFNLLCLVWMVLCGAREFTRIAEARFAIGNLAGLSGACTASLFSSVQYNGVLIVFVLVLAFITRVDGVFAER